MFAELLMLLLSGPALAETPALVDAGDTKVLLVDNDRYPIAWIRIVVPIARDSLWRENERVDLFWGSAVALVLRERKSTAAFTPWVGWDSYGIDVEFLVSEMDTVLDDIRSLTKGSVSKYRVPLRNLGRGGGLRASPSALIQRSLTSVFYDRDDPRWALLTDNLKGRISTEDLRALVDRSLGMPGVRIGFAGAVSPEEVKASIDTMLPERGFATEPSLDRADRGLVVPAETDQTLVVEGGYEVILGWARPGLTPSEAIAPAALVATQVLRQRLTAELREGRGDTYHVYVSGLFSRPRGVLTILTTTSPQRAKAHREAVVGLLRKVTTQGLTDEEVHRVQRSLRRSLVSSGSPWEDLVRALPDTDDHRIQGLIEEAVDVPVADVDAAARSLFQPEAFIRAAVVPREQLEVFEGTGAEEG
ncbi:MAG: insulinase family protein [Myxococcota bacterium]